METSAILVVFICAFTCSLSEANFEYGDKFQYCNNTQEPNTRICKPWDSSAVVEVIQMESTVHGKETRSLVLIFQEDPSQEFRKLNLTEGAYSHPLVLRSVRFNDVNIQGASSPFINQSLLESVILKKNGLEEFPRDFFRGIPNLKHLAIFFQNFPTLSQNLLSEISENLLTLDLSENSVRHIEANAFSKFSKLMLLDLMKNLLTELQPSLFAGLYSLNTLYLDGNKLTTIHSRAFEGLYNLDNLSLDRNEFNSLPENIFEDIQNARFVTFSGNWTEDRCKAFFKGFKYLMIGECGTVTVHTYRGSIETYRGD